MKQGHEDGLHHHRRGPATIMQSEVEGIPLEGHHRLREAEIGHQRGWSPIGSDGYDYAKMGID